jgi:hypothetical protein
LDIAIYLEATPGVDSDLFMKTKNLHPILEVAAKLEVAELEVGLVVELLRVQLKFHKQ